MDKAQSRLRKGIVEDVIEDWAFRPSLSRAVRNTQIDSLFISLAKAMEARAVGIILFGYGVDGTQGCRQIKESGGTTFAQDKSAAIAEMSLSAQASGCIDFVLPPNKIAIELMRLQKKTSPTFDANAFLATVGLGRTVSTIALAKPSSSRKVRLTLSSSSEKARSSLRSLQSKARTR